MGKLKTIPKDSECFKSFLLGLCRLLNSQYAESGGRAKIEDSKIIFEQSWEPSESSPGHYQRVQIAIEKVQLRE